MAKEASEKKGKKAKEGSEEHKARAHKAEHKGHDAKKVEAHKAEQKTNMEEAKTHEQTEKEKGHKAEHGEDHKVQTEEKANHEHGAKDSHKDHEHEEHKTEGHKEHKAPAHKEHPHPKIDAGEHKKAKEHTGGSWVDYKPAEVEELIVVMANQGMTPSEIGMNLRDQHGIPSVKKLTGMNLEAILEKKGLSSDMPRDLLNLISKSVTLFRHMNTNKKDMTAKRGYILTVSKIRKLTKYYSEKGKLAKEWKYTPQAAELLVK